MRAAIFDIDGTLLQSDAHDDVFFLASVRAVLGEVTLRPSWGLYTHFSATGILAEILSDNAIDATPDRIAAVRDHFAECVRRHVAEHGPFAEVPGAKDFVEHLHRSKTHQVAYATGGWRDSAQLKLSLAGFPVAGVPLAASNDHTDRREIMRHALRQLAGSFASVTYYGDGQWDSVAAEALGWQFVAVGKKLNGLTRFELNTS